MKKIMLLSVLLIMVATCFSYKRKNELDSTYQLFTIGYSFMSDAKFNDPYKNDDEWNNASVGMKTMDVDVAYPMFFNNNHTVFIPSVEYSYVQSYYKDEPKHTPKEELHDVQGVLRFQQKIGSAFMVEAHAAPGLSFDWKNGIESDDFIMRGGLTLDWKFNDKLTVRGGAVYDTPFGKQEIVPLLGATYQTGDLVVSALLPLNVDIHWIVNREVAVGVLGDVKGYRFNLQNGEPADQYEATDPDFQSVDYLEYSRVDLGPIIYWNIFDNFWFDIHSGVTLRKQYSFYDTKDEEMPVGNRSGEPSFFLSVNTRYRVPMPE